jgi:hypothetical protein
LNTLQPSELQALISLLDDTDKEVFEHVSGKLIALGLEGIPVLEAAWEKADNEIIQRRLEDLIDNIQFESIVDKFSRWVNRGNEDLLEGALLVARCHYPELDEHKIRAIIDGIVKNVWVNLTAGMTPEQEVRVLNRILYVEMGFNGNKQPEPETDLAYINTVIETRHGNSLGLGILYLIVAHALDLNIYGINLPYHFILCCTDRWLTKEELDERSAEKAVKFYINPLLEGVPFSKIEITRYLDKSQIYPEPKYYAPCNNLSIIRTLIYNQISCYEEKGDIDRLKKLRTLYDLCSGDELPF